MLGTELSFYKYWINYSLHQHQNVDFFVFQKQNLKLMRLKKFPKFIFYPQFFISPYSQSVLIFFWLLP